MSIDEQKLELLATKDIRVLPARDNTVSDLSVLPPSIEMKLIEAPQGASAEATMKLVVWRKKCHLKNDSIQCAARLLFATLEGGQGESCATCNRATSALQQESCTHRDRVQHRATAKSSRLISYHLLTCILH